MSFEPVFETINYKCGKKVLTEQIKSECRSDVSTDAVSSVLNVSAFTTISQTQVVDGKVEYGGKIIFYISYVDADGRLCKCECGSEYKGNIKNECIKTDSLVTVKAAVEKAYSDLSGARLVANAFISLTAEITSCEQVSALAGGENLVIKESELSYVKSCGIKKATYPIEEEFQLGYAVSEVLSHRAQAVITAVQCGVGCIIVDGEVIISAIMLQNEQRNDIIKENKTIPFRMEIECEDAMPNMQAIARVKENSFKTDVSVDQEAGVSVVGVSVSLEFEGEAFYNDVITVASDAFSTEQEIELVEKDLLCTKAGELKNCYSVVSGRCATNELPVGASVLAVGGERAEILNVVCDGQKTIVNGTLSATAYMRDNEKTFTVFLETPFESSLDCCFECSADLEVVAKAKNARARIVSLTETELESDINFTIYPEERNQIKVIGEIKSIGEKVKNDCAVSVYIPTNGEDLWSLAKRLNVCPVSLAQTNSDLKFPLTGEERIVIYRQK